MLRARFLLPALLFTTTAFAEPAKFTGVQSCATSGCHGGGTGKDQFYTWQKKDVHSRAHTILLSTRSQRMAETLKIEDASKSARCTICHSPLEALPAGRFMKDVKPDKGVSCETCHSPAESWLRYHTRTDISHEQRIAGGIRKLDDYYSRANACVACHQNIDPELVKAGHPEMFFELDGQTAHQPPHWTDEGDSKGPRAWLTGQAVALREVSWKLSKAPDAELELRWKSLAWLLRRTPQGMQLLTDTADYAAMQIAADKLARDAARRAWPRAEISKTLRDLAALNTEFRDSPLDPTELRRRAEVLVLAVDRLWAAWKQETNSEGKSANLDKIIGLAAEQARTQLAFDRAKFAAALQQVEVALELMPKP